MNKSHYLSVLVLLIGLVFLMPQQSQANDYLEQQKHYSTRIAGADCIHFCIPVWAYGAYDYYAIGDSYIYYRLSGSKDNVLIANYKSENYGENESDNGRGSAWINLRSDKGDIVVTSMASGVNYHIDAGDWTGKLVVKQHPDDDSDQVTFLEFDWYPPQDLNDTTFIVGVHSVFRRSVNETNQMEKTFDLGSYKGGNNDMTPQLFTPYLYQVNASGTTGYGYAAIPYSTFYATLGYTLKGSEEFQKNTNRSDNLYVMTSDTTQEEFYAVFREYRNEELGTIMEQKSTVVDIPAYHRIYQFDGTEELDSTDTYTGNIVLHWDVKNPNLKDLVEGDYFEIQRALKSDYSDAQTLKVVSLARGEDKGHYTYLDDSRDTWSGNASVISQDTTQAKLSTRIDNYELHDAEDNVMARLNLQLTADKIVSPGIDVYYRIRRASSSIWGWDHEFAKTISLARHNFLAPLADDQAAYTKDADFDTNHNVHFAIKLDNKEVHLEVPDINDCTFSYEVKNDASENISLEITTTSWQSNTLRSEVYLTLYDSHGEELMSEWQAKESKKVDAKRGGSISIRYKDARPDADWQTLKYNLDGPSNLKIDESVYKPMSYGYNYFSTKYSLESSGTVSPEIDTRVQELQSSLKQMLWEQMSAKIDTSLGRCMWDRTARVVLIRSSEESPEAKMEIAVPQDSIIRQEDGSWIAYITDVADRPCTHFTYAVRIDQSTSDLHVQDSVQLLAKPLTGPSLYYDNAAEIVSFSATRGATETAYKPGVLLFWTPSSNAVDEYVLQRKEKDSSASADTLYTGVEATYFDKSAVPDVVYEYTVTARYSCNGKHSDNSRTTEGWRTPYGEISGQILMPDNSGMADIQVALQDTAGNIIRKMKTTASGAYKFDSLKYYFPADSFYVNFVREQGEGCSDPNQYLKFQIQDENGKVLKPYSLDLKGKVKVPANAIVSAKTDYDQIYNKGKAISKTVTRNGTFTGRFEFAKVESISEWREQMFAEFVADSGSSVMVTSMDYVIVPEDEHATFSFNNTDAGTASITLSTDNAVAQHIDFVNTNTVRLTGRALYHLSTVPVAGAMLLLNGDTVHRGGNVLTTGIDGNFEIAVTTGKTYTLQIVKPGHTFLNDGYLEVKEGEREFALSKPLDGVRFYDQTKVRLVGRVAGGNNQRDLPPAFGKGYNNLGDDLMLVLQLEGDNTAQLIHDPDDLSRDTLQNIYPQIVYNTDTLTTEPERVVGTTTMLTQKKRIIIYPDPLTGEYAVDLFPTKYKVVQATANGYATLFAPGQGMETFDLTNAPLTSYDPKIGPDSVHYNAVYDRIYHTPVQVHLRQILNGIIQDGYGEAKIEVSTPNLAQTEELELYRKTLNGTVVYVLGNPLFYTNHKYQFVAEAYEEYYYNNNEAQEFERVPWRGGEVIVRNGMETNGTVYTFPLDEEGRNSSIYLPVDYIDVETEGKAAMRTISVALKTEGNVVESESISGFVVGSLTEWGEMESTDTNIQLFDIIRDPGGAGSYSYIEKGSTYSFGYTFHLDAAVGINLQPTWGSDVSMNVGIVTGAVTAGTYTGQTISAASKLSFDLPIVFKWDNGSDFSYTFTTNERISTSSESSIMHVGTDADVYVGATMSRLVGKVKSVAVINDSLYQMRQPALESGAMLLLASGKTLEGEKYYLVTGEKIAAGMFVNNTFAYSHYHIMESVIPRLIMKRSNLLMHFNDSASARSAANAMGEPVYWYHKDDEEKYGNYYSMILPEGDGVFTDQVAALDNLIISWAQLVAMNEKEKVEARTKGQLIGTYSVSEGATLSHSDNYSTSAGYNEVPFGNAFGLGMLGGVSEGLGSGLMQWVGNVFTSLANGNSRYATTLSKSVAEAVDEFYNHNEDGSRGERKNEQEIGTMSNGWSFKMNYTPVADLNLNPRWNQTVSQSRTQGFTLVPDSKGDITISVYRAQLDSAWKEMTQEIRQTVNQKDNNDILYGSYVFHTIGGSSYCPYEDEERTQYYNPGSVLNNATLWVHKPEMTADCYEKTNVDPSTRATFRVNLMNNSQLDTGYAPHEGAGFYLALDGVGNPDGAKVFVNGAPLGQSLWYWLTPGTPAAQTIEVERGTADDYDLTISLYLADCPKTSYDMHLAVHFLPESSPVAIALPRPNWVMNTLSPRDSVGYYLPIEINGFNLNHKNFDHIEFQYKLASESDEKWVNMCSFYADDSLCQLASGNKAMIENGKITPFRFYGEKDPMEQRYDLRAVTYCRYGSGYVTKSSPVVSGIKDTRPPRMFGHPEPANSILTVEKNLLLRYNEAIAGNYLDEDNNFRIVGITNETGVATSTALQFDGTSSSYAATKVKRNLADTPFTVEMMVKPTDPTGNEVFFSHGGAGRGIVFGKTSDNRLYVQTGNSIPVHSKPLDESILAFTRVAFTYDPEEGLRFYAGTLELTDSVESKLLAMDDYRTNAPFVFGNGYTGEMLEARVWTKALTPEEISATNNRYLTGYENELLTYYHMNEGKGEHIDDCAHGATLYLNGCTWNMKQGFSLFVDKQPVQLDGNLLSRSTAYDETLMFWFRTKGDGNLFSANRTEPTDSTAGVGTRISIEQGNIAFYNANRSFTVNSKPVNDDEWHHLVLTVNRTFDNASLFIDGELSLSVPATKLTGITGAMYLGGNDFTGHFDEFAVFEQALPRALFDMSDNFSFVGDEMGLMGYLPFEETYTNSSGVMALRFSVNDQRQFRDPNGNVIDKIVPLVLSTVSETMQDDSQNAPTNSHGQLTKLRFDWSSNDDELLINILNQDYEINKQSIYITVRDVEDLNGNPMSSPVTWTAFVDRNSLKWSEKQLVLNTDDSFVEDEEVAVKIVNLSGKRHTYSVESLPAWLSVDKPSGAIDPMAEQMLTLTISHQIPVGEYHDVIYLTDEDGLSEPLQIYYTINAIPPYTEIDNSLYPYNMSVCGQVIISNSSKAGNAIDADERDMVYALYRNQCVGIANISVNAISNTTEVYLTVLGNEEMLYEDISFQLWQASTGKIYNLAPSRKITFAHGFVYGCGDEAPIVFTTTGSEMQEISISKGWNWISTRLNLMPEKALLNETMTAAEPWHEGDQIKNPGDRLFSTWSEADKRFVGSLTGWNYQMMYMLYAAATNTLRLSGDDLTENDKQVTLRGSGQWNALPCLLSQTTEINDAMADYFNNATSGDIVKAHNRFAVFSPDKRWVGNLTALRPGEGYLMRRMATGSVNVHFYDKVSSKNKKPVQQVLLTEEPFTNPNAATNMTMIATLDNHQSAILRVYVGDELAGVAEPVDSLYFLTIQNDKGGTLRFELEDGTELSILGQLPVVYSADTHHGSLKAPIVLSTDEQQSRTYKIIENGHLFIIRDNERYDVTGKILKQ